MEEKIKTIASAWDLTINYDKSGIIYLTGFDDDEEAAYIIKAEKLNGNTLARYKGGITLVNYQKKIKKMEYKASDFYEVGLVKSDVIKHVIDNVRDFSKRYDVATDYALYYRCSQRTADPMLYEEIVDAVFDCLESKNIDASSFEDEVYEDIEIVFN